MNETDTLINRIDSWTADVLADDLKMAAWVAACQSTNDAHKDAVIDDLLGEKPIPGAVRVATNGTIEWTDGNEWQMAHDRSKY